MRIQAKDTAQTAYLDDSSAGEAVSIFFSQDQADTVRWRIDVYAKLNNGIELAVGTFYVSPPPAAFPKDRLTRLVAIAVCPGAVSWSATCAAQTPGTNEDATIELFSSKCCTSPCGLTRVSERYGYFASSAASATQTLNTLPGQVITRIILTGLTGGGSAAIGTGNTIVVPAGTTIALEPKAPINNQVNALTFTNVDWTVEFLESA